MNSHARWFRRLAVVLCVACSLWVAPVDGAENGLNCRAAIVRTIDSTGTKWTLHCTSPCDEQKGCEQWEGGNGTACRCPDVTQVQCCDLDLDEDAEGVKKVVPSGYCTDSHACPIGGGKCEADDVTVHEEDREVTYFVAVCNEE